MNFKKISEKFTKKWLQEYINKFSNKKNIKINTKQKIDFFDSIANLINAWIPITNALNIMLYQTKNKNIASIIEETLKNINKGKSISESLKSFPYILNQFDLYMIKMWEVTGKMGDAFEIIREREEKNHDIKSKILGALIYPMIIVTLSICMIVGFMLFVIPKVQKMYVDARVNLPSLTQHVIDISMFLQENYLLLLLILWAAIFWGIQFKNHPKTKIYADHFFLRIPIFGPLLRKRTLAIFTSTFWTLLQNGIMINEALEISKKSVENNYYEKKLDFIMEQVNEGIKLSELFGIHKLKDGIEDPDFPIELASITKIWEQTGKLPSLLLRLSVKFHKEIDSLVKGIQTAIEPIVIIVVGAIVGTMIMAILLPFFNMVNVL